MRLWIKGNPVDAVRAASERNVPLLKVEPAPHKGETLAETDNQYAVQVIEWYGEHTPWDGDFGYPIGTLLLYRL